jgi:hypothetical protein
MKLGLIVGSLFIASHAIAAGGIVSGGPAQPQPKEAFALVKIIDTASERSKCEAGKSLEAKLAAKRAFAKLAQCDSGVPTQPELLPFNVVETDRGLFCSAHAWRACK